jgi:hypothetical protein
VPGGPPAHLPSTMPGLALAAPPCRLWLRRHVPRVAWPGVPPATGGLFWQKNSQGVLSGISLVQVVQCVKNSITTGFGYIDISCAVLLPCSLFPSKQNADRGCSTLTFWNTLECEQLASLSNLWLYLVALWPPFYGSQAAWRNWRDVRDSCYGTTNRFLQLAGSDRNSPQVQFKIQLATLRVYSACVRVDIFTPVTRRPIDRPAMRCRLTSRLISNP